ncbi:hypothetical protein CEUSTIGMA_g2286.t1 [Chlamydomonas eustigma]|uniref:Transmembrane protein 107 n=1 Tax=Chlamydomonas eustigma TaxID=1157962 RepID=A0A250WWE0_9CHLO|nr:hypothetical protein CEUSTIGMA_g2286.t1 [Chlamydomonas eustigma]|eukprot:GAX74840.1 hypothetical protein CEUSTIGMA_g2286.t1 [Chlamydomonas eustigma]
MARIPYFKAEEVTIPLRFIVLTAHFIAVLAVVFALTTLTGSITQVDVSSPNTPQSSITYYNITYNKLSGFAYAALACFGVEFITLFLGVSIFIRPMMLINIIAHFLGLILDIVFYIELWPVAAWISFVVVFNFVPLTLELGVWAFMSRFTYARY